MIQNGRQTRPLPKTTSSLGQVRKRLEVVEEYCIYIYTYTYIYIYIYIYIYMCVCVCMYIHSYIHI